MYELSCQACAPRDRTMVQKVAVRAANSFNLNKLCLRSHSLSRRPCSLAVALHARSHGLAEVHVGVDIQSIVKYLNTHMRAQCSHASVGLDQACPNHNPLKCKSLTLSVELDLLYMRPTLV